MKLEAETLAGSLVQFVQAAWPLVDSHAFVLEPHIEAICAHLEAVTRGEIRLLIVNIPPRHSKSSIIGVLWPVWCWIRSPGTQFLSAARSKGLASRDAVKARQLMQSAWFRERWGDRFSLLRSQNTQMRYVNDRGGHRVATAVGQGTGDGGDIVVIDDPTTAEQALSEAERGRANRWLDNTISTRFNDPKTGRLVLVMQRLHGDDMTAHILREAEAEVVHLRLPAEFEPAEACVTVPLPGTGGKPWRDWRRKEGEILAPIRFPKTEIDRLKRRLRTPYNIAGQLQQRPTSLGGEIFRRQWWVIWTGDKAPESMLTIASLDTAMSEKDNAAGSACTVWQVYEDTQGKVPQTMVLLRFAWREQLTFNALVEKVHWTMGRYRAERLLVEMKANGISVVQELRRRFRWAEQGIEQINPSIDKVARANSISHFWQGGLVAAPKLFRLGADGLPLRGHDGEPLTYTPDWAQMVLDEMAEFPRGRYADLTDTATQAISWLRRRDIVFFREDDYQPSTHTPAPSEGYY